jgi:hypothetical protein
VSLDSVALLDAIATHALTLGVFERVARHEPKSAPGSGVSAALWADYIGPWPAGSGLASTTGVVVVNMRVQLSMLAEPYDDTDPRILAAVDAMMAAASGDYDLGVASVRCVDLLGQSGYQLAARAGYLNQNGTLYRVMVLTIPVIVNDLWDQVT